MKARALLAALAVAAAAACASGPTKADAPIGVHKREGDRLAARPFISVFDALEKVWLPGGSFVPGAEIVFAPMHSGVHATLFYVALRGTLDRHVHHSHEETIFFYEGTGTLLLGDGRAKAIEAGTCVRIPPGVAHGYKGSRTDPLKGVCVVSPTLEADDFELAESDEPGLRERAWVGDPTSTDALPPLDPVPDSVARRKFLHSSKWSTLQVAAVRRDVIPDHLHAHHDETVIVFAQAGFGFMRMNEVVHVVQPGSVAHVPAGAVHGFEHKAEGHARAISIFTPGYDGTDLQAVKEEGVVQAPPGYRKQGWDEFHEGKRADPHLMPRVPTERVKVEGDR